MLCYLYALLRSLDGGASRGLYRFTSCRCCALCGLRRLCGVACASCSLPQGPRILNDSFPSGAISVGLIGGTATCCGGTALLRPAAICRRTRRWGSLLFEDVLAPLGLLCLLNDSPALIGSLVARAVYGFLGGLLDAVFSILFGRFILAADARLPLSPFLWIQ